MNYRHAFHAGNFADVVKHAILARILEYLKRKDAPFRFIDTHAGAGRYDLTSPEARRSPEWRDGVQRVLTASPPPAVAALLEPYLRALGPLDASGVPAFYPGSPAVAQTLMRADDRIALCEAHPEEREKLVAALGHDSRLSIVGTDGYVALNAYLPPRERRGLVLIDPPFEAPDEPKRVEEALRRALRKWPIGVFLAWRPIREAAADAHVLNNLAALGLPAMLRIEIDVGPGPAGAQGQRPLSRAGLLVVNPPHTLIDEARVLLPWLAGVMGRDGRGASVCAWLTPPR
ncbi:23S rRNA (adenine2030-N6)-methyltransferase [Roseiarcus fermentans]|uniref:Ribosomal RNA large subunit methyltransferase J n=1 Tax=Roseiarcus fermentans TaxID=1473586 RepID=A0A366FTG2_9HYPH|nr:23S rRNA (adenine(2030)-N(6))-methyltransferase RlmJ [Roseiarcus fermentans]RBP17330.1 23S rRNA (adenine2030-N6)-methyltransferase [Roseiarcus fermentans]